MTFSLKIWNKPGTDEVRLYINGTTRQSLYFAKSSKDGRLVWSSKANDTPHKFQTGDHYGKIQKDRKAAEMVAEAFGLKLGEQGEFERALEIAKAGIEAGADE